MTELSRRITLALTTVMWEELTAALDSDVETAWCLTARLIDVDDSSGSQTLIARELFPVGDEFYISRTRNRLEIASQGWVPAFGAAASDGSVPVFVHTHPGGEANASSFDATVDGQLADVAAVRTPSGVYASLVLGGESTQPAFTGRLRRSDSSWTTFSHLRVAGSQIHVLGTSNSDGSPPVLPAFDRQVRAFGADGQGLLQLLRVGVVGAGGTGSAVIEQLIRLGVGEIVVLDPQRLTDTNVTRVYGSGSTDEDALKVVLAERQTERIGLSSSVLGLAKECTDLQGAQALAHCDLIFGCTDDNAGRAVLTRFPAHLLQHLIDCAVVIDSRNEAVYEVLGRLSIVTPGSACLLCMNDIDQDRALAEALPRDEYERRRSEGYAPDLDTPDPAVVTYTTAIAAAAVSELLQRVFHLGVEDPPNRHLHRFISRAVSSTRREPTPTHWCQNQSTRGASTPAAFLGRRWTAPS